jgi:hypothetical protein
MSEYHLSERDLILAADGELPAARKAEVAAHLETCWSCRERMQSLEGTITEFVRARNRELNSQLPSAEGPRALLRARLAEAAAVPARRHWFSLPAWGRMGVAAGAFVAVFVGIVITFAARVNAEAKPRPMTTGETRPITLREVCAYEKAEVISRDIPEDKQRAVFAMYGIKSPRPGEFEIDYLITPDLGGAESIRNLWPEPYSARWNAHVKDELEQKLHELVCSGKLDLATAQHDMAVDWIAAWKKYVAR